LNPILLFKQSDATTWHAGFVDENGDFVVISSGHRTREETVSAIFRIMNPGRPARELREGERHVD
jgi:hypothetical protein